jgi:hypothetical protein
VATFVSDTFTDTDAVAITSHTGETGATWTKHGFATNTTAPAVRSNRINCEDTGGAVNSIYYASGSPAGADYTVSLAYVPGSGGAQTGDIVGPLGRVATGTNDFYGALYLQTAGGIRLYKFVSGSGTVIVAAVAFTPVSGTTYTITLDMQGTTIAMRVQRSSDSNWLASSNTWQSGQVNCGSVTDASHSSAGKAGFWLLGGNANNGAKFKIDTFVAADASSGGLSIPVAMSQYRQRWS